MSNQNTAILALGLDALFEQCPFGLALVSPDHRLQRVNPAFAQITGHSIPELLHKTFDEITHPDDLALDAHLAGRVYAGELSHYEMEKRYIHKNGHPVRIHMTVYMLRDSDNQVACAVSMIRPLPPTNAPAKTLAATETDRDKLLQIDLDRLRHAILD